jgi:hypothetical protein
MAKTGRVMRGIERWTVPPPGVSVDDGGQIAMPPEAITPHVTFRGGMRAANLKSFMYLGPLGSSRRTLTVTFGPPVMIATGCFTGTLEEFRQELAYKAVGDPYRQEYEDALDFIERQAARWTGAGPAVGTGVPECGLGEEDRVIV